MMIKMTVLLLLERWYHDHDNDNGDDNADAFYSADSYQSRVSDALNTRVRNRADEFVLLLFILIVIIYHKMTHSHCIKMRLSHTYGDWIVIVVDVSIL